MKPIRPGGRDRILVYIEADNPHLKELRQQALFEATYSQQGRVVAYDLAFPASEARRVASLLQCNS
jgi:hypothetical protein